MKKYEEVVKEMKMLLSVTFKDVRNVARISMTAALAAAYELEYHKVAKDLE